MRFPIEKVSLIYLVLLMVLFVGFFPQLLTGWFLSENSSQELRALESRYQTQLVQDKARQIEMIGQRYSDLAFGIARAFEFSDQTNLSATPYEQEKLGQFLSENPYLVAISVYPIKGERISVYRAEIVDELDLERISSPVLARLGNRASATGQPQKLRKSGELVLAIAIPIMREKQIHAAVVCVFSLREISSVMSEMQPTSEEKLWSLGLPIVFVIDEQGKPVFHQDQQVVERQKPLTNLKIVQEWQQTSRQVQSALFPFTAEHGGKIHNMIGAYSTANIGNEVYLGVIVMQDEETALASVKKIRLQMLIISIAFAAIAVIIGSIFARLLTKPIFTLEAAANRIASGDLSIKISLGSFKEFETLGKTFNLMSEKLKEHIEKLARAARENRELFVGTVKALAAAIDGKDKYTRGHSERVARFSVEIGKYLGISEEELEKLRISALLHDVGKIAIDDKILKKPAALTEEEYEIMKTHPQKGYKIMSQIPAMKDFLPGMYMHHEMVNGQGYPQGLKGDQIPLQAKIISVADTFDAMTTDRPYQKGMKMEEALKIIRSYVGIRYDGKVVEALVKACEEGKIRPVSAGHPNKAKVSSVTSPNSSANVEISLDDD
jgi:HD-GYP domain-containing protein (c-di-GMP phosphodiesterase class II)